MERSNEPTLLGLPTEMRLSILELVVYHKETNGVISPRADNPNGTASAFPRRFALWEATGRRFLMVHDQYPLKAQDNYWIVHTRSGEALEMWKCTPNHASKHTCTLDCLVQPAITRTCAQLRAESLSMFYELNHFHLEMDNHLDLERFREDVEIHPYLRPWGRSPAFWWRALNPAHVARIHRLSIVGRGFDRGFDLREPFDGNLVTFNEDRGVKIIYGPRWQGDWVPWGSDRFSDITQCSEWPKDVSMEMKEEGLKIEMIEDTVEWLEPWPGNYLPPKDGSGGGVPYEHNGNAAIQSVIRERDRALQEAV
jgi:hypothetical protein